MNGQPHIFGEPPGPPLSTLPESPLHDVPHGPLKRVIALGTHVDRNGYGIELLSLELYDIGAILHIRAVGSGRPGDEELLWRSWSCVVSDSHPTTYETASGGVGRHNLWRGEVLISPAPPDGETDIQIELRGPGPFTEPAVFAVTL
jgi:hypothetical protein